MLKSYFKTALRFLLRNRAFSFINIFGLAVGTACCLYIVLFVADQYSYDRYYTHAKDIYRVTADLTLSGVTNKKASSSPPLAPAMKNDFPEVAQYTRIVPIGNFGSQTEVIRYKEKAIYEKTAMYVDSTFFDVFNFHAVSGDLSTALKLPHSVVLLKPVADRIFGTGDPVGKMITIEDPSDKQSYTVTAVIDHSLGNTHIPGSIFITMNSGGFGSFTLTNNRWATNNYAISYVRLRPGTDPLALEKKLPVFMEKYGGDQLRAKGMRKVLHLQPVGTIHTTAGYLTEFTRTISTSFLYTLLVIAALIQLIACINFMNLSTARASKRAKEVGVRKVIGAGRKELIQQFLGESFIMALLGVLIAIPVLALTIPWLNGITGSAISLNPLKDFRIWFLLTGLVLLTGLIAGGYPAFYLSAFRAVRVIKGNFTSHISAAGIRRSLVVFQFVLSIVLISSIVVIYSQLNYIRNKDLGFSKEQRMVFHFYTEEARKSMPAFAADLRQLAAVKDVTIANNYPSQHVFNDWMFYIKGADPSTAEDIQMMFTDEHFVKTSGIRIISGRDFRSNDTGRALINETVVRRLGLKTETAPGTLLYPQDDQGYLSPPVEIIGVIKDFNYNSLRDNINPFMFRYSGSRDDMSHMLISTSTNDYPTLLGKIQALWQQRFSALPFDYAFLDEEVQKQYQTEAALSRIINTFTLLAILISCLGLFGLAAFSAEQRSREIGIRKVLGASVPGIAGLLSKDFLKLVGIAILIATPIAWWAMNQWLGSFVYRITLSWWMFGLAGLIAVFIAVATVSFQSVKAALANPVKSLRSD